MTKKKTKQQELFDLLESISGQKNIVAVPRLFLQILDGDYPAAVLLSQLIYWSGKEKHPEKGIAKTDRELQEELCITHRKAQRARTILEGKRMLTTSVHKFAGNPTLHYKLHQNVIIDYIKQYLGNRDTTPKSTICTFRKVQNVQNEKYEKDFSKSKKSTFPIYKKLHQETTKQESTAGKNNNGGNTSKDFPREDIITTLEYIKQEAKSGKIINYILDRVCPDLDLNPLEKTFEHIQVTAYADADNFFLDMCEKYHTVNVIEFLSHIQTSLDNGRSTYAKINDNFFEIGLSEHKHGMGSLPDGWAAHAQPIGKLCPVCLHELDQDGWCEDCDYSTERAAINIA